MPKVTGGTNLSNVNLDSLKQLAEQSGDTDKIRGRATTNKHVFSKNEHFKELYSSGKKTGKFEGGKRAEKRELAREFISSALQNTISNFTHRDLSLVMQNIMNEHIPTDGDITGANLKAIIADVENVLELEVETLSSQLNQTTQYSDFETKQKGLMTSGKPGTPVSQLSIRKHIQSVFRLPGKLDMSITVGDQTHQISTKAESRDEVPEREQFLADLFSGVNNALGNDLSEEQLQERVETYSNFGNAKAEHLNPFRDGDRVDNGENQDILILKFATKEMSAYALTPLSLALQGYCESNGMDKYEYSLAVRDQMDSVEIEIHENGNFTTTGGVTIPLKGPDGEEIANVRVTVESHVNSLTGEAEVSVTLTNLTFNDNATPKMKSDLHQALNQPLPT